jgi:hypothetical protein
MLVECILLWLLALISVKGDTCGAGLVGDAGIFSACINSMNLLLPLCSKVIYICICIYIYIYIYIIFCYIHDPLKVLVNVNLAQWVPIRERYPMCAFPVLLVRHAALLHHPPLLPLFTIVGGSLDRIEALRLVLKMLLALQARMCGWMY